ncbi:MFS transporter [Streptomyces roseirectus]|uniref:MFS transporter n=1 Tax=Streptomyces roseirectus TaxID=2768066 RepID=A0A7H0IMQ0_9ACTN|nr:MFS transporter [Streptomyces roseirectus]QNP74066.1 MFS transporter [Streptomyces roseirectus]
MTRSAPDQQPRDAVAEPAPPPERHRIAALALGVMATPTALSANAATTTLPDIADGIGISVPAATWIATVFGLAMALGTPMVAALLRHRGVRPAVLLCSLLVIAGTVVVLTADSMPGLIAGRAAQAFGGGGFITTAINLAGTPARMGVITAGSGMLGAIGPLSGSLLSDHVSWHAALSLSAVALLAAPYVYLRAPKFRPAEGHTAFDATGAVLTAALISSLVLLGRFPLPAVLAAAVLVGALTAWIRRRPEGFVPAALLRSPVYLTACAVVCSLSTAYFALLYAVPRLLEDDAGWDTSAVGVGILVALLIGSSLSWVMAASANRIRRSTVLTVLLTLGALAPLTVALGVPAPLMLAAGGVAVFVTASGQATLSVIAVTGAPDRLRTTALGLFTLCYQLGAAFGPAIVALSLA